MEGFLRAMAVAAALLVPAGAAWAGLVDESKPIDCASPSRVIHNVSEGKK